MSDHKPETTAAATNVGEVIAELDGGMFERMLSIALSQVSAAVIDHEKVGSVTVSFKLAKIAGTHQVRMSHDLKFIKPTSTGKTAEKVEGATVLHVGKYGALSLAQPSLLDKAKQTSFPT
jgi:hypothetical protein